MHPKTYKIHTPVLLDATLQYLDPAEGESYLDLTAGYGGHAQAIIQRTGLVSAATLVDRDIAAIEALTPLQEQGAELLHTDFLSASEQLRQAGKHYDMILADLGVSSLHLDRSERGFTFRESGPLDMRMDQRGTVTAADIVNSYSESELIDILRRYGEEPRAKRIAATIVAKRPFTTTEQLAEAIRSTAPRPGRIHPATKSFQALRIAVNDELGLLERSLPIWLELLKPGGRLAVISFHSLEDRIIKRSFNEVSGNRYDAEFRELTKRPVVANDDELVLNPRARSAKLRVVAKIKKERDSNYANPRKK